MLFMLRFYRNCCCVCDLDSCFIILRWLVMFQVISVQYLLCVDGGDVQSNGGSKATNLSRCNSDAALEISELCRHMEDLTADEV